jgi:hypothetical protein
MCGGRGSGFGFALLCVSTRSWWSCLAKEKDGAENEAGPWMKTAVDGSSPGRLAAMAHGEQGEWRQVGLAGEAKGQADVLSWPLIGRGRVRLAVIGVAMAGACHLRARLAPGRHHRLGRARRRSMSG